MMGLAGFKTVCSLALPCLKGHCGVCHLLVATVPHTLNLDASLSFGVARDVLFLLCDTMICHWSDCIVANWVFFSGLRVDENTFLVSGLSGGKEDQSEREGHLGKSLRVASLPFQLSSLW